jgi:predicted enzyme related to lactoylglutathione lyase
MKHRQTPSSGQAWHGSGRLLSILVLCALLLTGCAQSDKSAKEQVDETVQFSLTPVTLKPTRQYHPGKIVWHDLLTRDSLAAREFYGKLFGWTFEQHDRYVMILNDTTPIGGILEVPDVAPVWLASMSVDDVDKAAAYTQAHGGKVLTGPLDMKQRGRGVLINDPYGATLVLLHAEGGDPDDVEPPFNSWLWNELWSTNPEGSLAFYEALGSYDATLKEESYQILINQDRWRAGLRTVEKNDKWVPIVRVEDLEAVTAKVTELGGTVWIAPGKIEGDEDTALISDPAGALLMIQRWSSQPATAGQ